MAEKLCGGGGNMPPNCVRDPTNDCIGYAEAQILRHQIEEIIKQQETDRANNRNAHKEFFNRLESGERNQALTQQQLSQILENTTEIKNTLRDQARSLDEALEKQNEKLERAIQDQERKLDDALKRQDDKMDKAIEKQNQAISELQMKPAKKWEFLSNEAFRITIAVVAAILLTAVGLGAFR